MSRSFATCSGATRLAVRPSYSALRPRCLNDLINPPKRSLSLVACQRAHGASERSWSCPRVPFDRLIDRVATWFQGTLAQPGVRSAKGEWTGDEKVDANFACCSHLHPVPLYPAISRLIPQFSPLITTLPFRNQQVVGSSPTGGSKRPVKLTRTTLKCASNQLTKGLLIDDPRADGHSTRSTWSTFAELSRFSHGSRPMHPYLD